MSALQGVLSELRKKGYETGDLEKKQEFYSTGNIIIDEIMGGGIPVGRMVEVYGLPSSGKTTLALMTAARVQESGGKILFLDFERSLDTTYAKALGLSLTYEDGFLYFQPASLEDGGDIMRALLETKEIDLIIVDSVARMTTRKELDSPTGTITVADRAKSLTQLCRQILNQLSDYDTSIIWLNHILDVIETGFGAGKGPKQTTTPGGNSIKYYSSMRVHCKQKPPAKTLDGSDPTENIIEINITKNKVGVPFKKATVRNVFGEGFSQKAAVFTILKSADLIEGSGWLTIDEVFHKVAADKKWREKELEAEYDSNAEFRGLALSLAREKVFGVAEIDTTSRDENGDELND